MTYYKADPVRFGSVSLVTATLGPNDPEVGTVVEEGDERYVLVYNNGATQISPGMGVTVSAVTGYSVTVSSVAQDWCMGVVKHATLTTATYGYVVTRGFAPIQASASVAIQPGDPIALGVDGFFTNAAISGATEAVQQAVGKCVVSAASATSIGDAFIALY